MKIPVSWLKEYVNVTQSPQELADMITKAGMEVEGIRYIGVAGADLVWDRELVLLGQLLKVEKHPDADTLVLATVDYGADEPKVVVTGAPNIHCYVGEGDISDLKLFSPIIFEGAQYLDPYKEYKQNKLKGKALRGIYNDSMLCAADELGISNDHDGIILLQQDQFSPQYVAGTPLQDVLGDAIIDVDIIPNIARCASIVGIAREVAALTGETVSYPDYTVVQEGESIEGKVEIFTENPELNPRFTAMLIEGVSQKPSPYWMQHRLRMAGQNPINVVVDISNYVMLEMGQPNHTFDYDFLRKRADAYNPNGAIQLITRLAHDGETLTTLDEKEHKLFPNNILVTDPKSYLSLGGIMGGLDSGIQENTTNVLLESAAWNFINIRHSQRQLGVHTEAGFRFSRGIHAEQAILGAKRAAELLRKLAGGTVAKGMIDFYPAPPEPVVVQLNPAYIVRRSGLDIGKAEITDLLERLEFTVVDNGDTLTVTVPPHRIDVDGQHDLLEEVCRCYGYDNIPETLLAAELPKTPRNKPFETEARIKDILVDLGWYEAITYRLTTKEAEAKATTGQAEERPYVTLANPATADRVVMRRNLLPSVLELVAHNSRFQDRIALFEIGKIYLPVDGELLPSEDPMLAITLTGNVGNETWNEGASRMADFFDLKGSIEALFAQLKLDVRYEPAEHPTFIPGRTANIYLGNSQKLLGTIGEVHPLVIENYEMRLSSDQAVLAANIDLTVLLNGLSDRHKVNPVPVYPAVQNDLALVVDKGVVSADIVNAITQAGGYVLKDVALFDIYEGDKLEAGKKSLAYHLIFQSDNKTLTDKDIQTLRKKILGAVKAKVGAELA